MAPVKLAFDLLRKYKTALSGRSRTGGPLYSKPRFAAPRECYPGSPGATRDLPSAAFAASSTNLRGGAFELASPAKCHTRSSPKWPFRKFMRHLLSPTFPRYWSLRVVVSEKLTYAWASSEGWAASVNISQTPGIWRSALVARTPDRQGSACVSTTSNGWVDVTRAHSGGIFVATDGSTSP